MSTLYFREGFFVVLKGFVEFEVMRVYFTEDQIEDFLRPLRYFTWGKKEDRFYLDLNRARAFTIGHGQLMRRYSPNVDIDEDNLFAQLDAYSDLGGFELVAGPLPLPRIVGGLLFVKPLGLFSDGYMAKSLSIGVSYLPDLNAPTVLLRQTNNAGETLLPVDDANQLLQSLLKFGCALGVPQLSKVDTVMTEHASR